MGPEVRILYSPLYLTTSSLFFLKLSRLYMASVDILNPFILSWEGGFVDDPCDAGGATNKGVTIATWRSQGYDKNGDGVIDVHDLKMISDHDACTILKRNYWDRWKADDIEDQSIANILVDWVWGSGSYGIRIPQRLLGVQVDGIVGSKTISALNSQDPRELFDKIHNRRREYLESICKCRIANQKFLRGWLRRLDSIQYGYLICNGGRRIEC